MITRSQSNSMLAALIVFLLFVSVGSAQSVFSKARVVDEAVKREMKRQNVVGAAIGIIRNFKIVYIKGYGLSNLKNRSSVNTSTVFNWASNSKPLMAVAALQLVQAGKLDLDKPIQNYLKKVPKQFGKITTRQLLCHQSGIPHYRNGRIISSGNSPTAQQIDPFIAVERFGGSPLIFQPGTKNDYSSYAYVLLSAVVQAAGKSKIESQLSKRISRPLNLTSFQLDLPFNGQKNWVTSYRISNGSPTLVNDYAHFWKHGAGGYKSDIRDFAKFAKALGEKRLLNERTTKIMWTNQKLANGNKTSYGLGVVVQGEGRSLKVSHNGSQDETRTRMVLYPNQKHGVVVMCNTQGVDPGRISTAVYSAMNR